MKAIIIGAGRGSRLMPTTADTPKCFAQVGDKRILDWILTAFSENAITDVAFIGGYQIDKVRQAYPQFDFCHNADWENNNILASFMHAEEHMDQPFICAYSDILFTPAVVKRLLANDADMTLVVDTDWQDRYAERTEHPADDAEKVTVSNGQVTEIHRDLDIAESHGEYIGVAKFSPTGARRLRNHYHRCRETHAGQPWREAKSFEKAYLIHLFQEMIEAGEAFAHVDTPGQYIEIDTQQDYEYARRTWTQTFNQSQA
jgi:choline kinase